jgi:aspartyl-tRNA(Asn)/glutamyl-tRNA(Gln) amidotransferase subunit A
MCTAALGSQTGGSTCRPAAYNGIVGLKPTYGRISKHGIVPLSWSLDTVGILVRSVEDAALMLQVMSGHDLLDPGSATEPVPDFLSQMGYHDHLPVIGLIKDYFFDESTKEVVDHTEAIAQKLSQAGAEIIEVSLPNSFESSHACQRVVSNVEAAAFHRQWYNDRADEYGPKIRRNIEMGMLISGVDYLQAQRLRRQLRLDMVNMLAGLDAVLMPTTPSPAPEDLSTTGEAVFQAPWTSSGLPTITIPSGLASNGLPLGVQFAGLPFAEGSLLGVAQWCEKVLDLDMWPINYR